MKKALALALAFVMVVSLLAGCQKKEQSPSGDPGEDGGSGNDAVIVPDEVDTTRKTTKTENERYPQITMALTAIASELYPWNVGATGKGKIAYLIYETLYLDDGVDYIPYLATGAPEVVDDYHWNVTIYDNIYDSAGNHITANDVVYSYNIVFDQGFASKCYMFEKIEAVGEYTVQFTWNKVIDSIDEVQWPMSKFYIVSQKAMEDPANDFASYPIATGPYKVTDFVSGSLVSLEARDDYWQTPEKTAYQSHATVQKIIFQQIAESSQVVIGLRNGTIDIADTDMVPTENLDEFVSSDNMQVSKQPIFGGYWILGNFADKYWADENFRKAVYYALDGDSIAEAGQIIPAKSLAGPYYEEYHNAWSSLDNYQSKPDPELAKEYLASSNYDGEKIQISVRNSESFKNMAVMVQALLKNVGIESEINPMDNTLVNAQIEETEGWTLHILAGSNGGLITAWNRCFNSGDFTDGLPYGHNPDAKLVELYRTANMTENFDMEHMTELMNYVIDNAYGYCIGSPTATFVYSDKIASLNTQIYNSSFVCLNECEYYLD